jgi:hypothetical protein
MSSGINIPLTEWAHRRRTRRPGENFQISMLLYLSACCLVPGIRSELPGAWFSGVKKLGTLLACTQGGCA